jgi:ATP-dependent RNA helicase DHX37/DHR1
VPLFVEHEVKTGDVSDTDESIVEESNSNEGIVTRAFATAPTQVIESDGVTSQVTGKTKTVTTFSFLPSGSSLKRAADGTVAQPSKRVLKKRQKREDKIKEAKKAESSSSGSDDDEGPKSMWASDVVQGETLKAHPIIPAAQTKPATVPTQKVVAKGPVEKAFHVPINRTEEIQTARLQLPVVGEEQQIMESISQNDVLILCSETGSGKTTQIPQFLYEAGYSHPEKYKGMIGVTQPRRVAAVSMANRVRTEMGEQGSGVGYQVRYDSQVRRDTRIKFMTDGILLRELSTASMAGEQGNKADLLMLKYSVIIIDEAHERTVGTDVLIGWLTRIVSLRNSGKIAGVPELKLIIMSATLRVDDFLNNTTLFPADKPPVVNVEGRQHSVTVHYNKRTTEGYVAEAYKKVCKIHTKLPKGGVLVFVTGMNEVQMIVKKLQSRFPTHGKKVITVEKNENEDKMGVFGSDEAEIQDDRVDDFEAMEQEEEDEEEEAVETLGGNIEDPIVEEEDAMDDGAPLYVLPLYSMLPTAAQLKVFESPPEGARLVVIATNVAETSLTIPNIRYVIDAGKVKEVMNFLTTAKLRYLHGRSELSS